MSLIMLDFGKLKNDGDFSCIFRNSMASHTRTPFLKPIGKAPVPMRAQI